MATKIREELVDDIDGDIAVETVEFAYAGVSYEIDLNAKNVAAMDAALAPYTAAARRTGGRKKSSPRTNGRSNGNGSATQPSTAEIREWAVAEGYEVSSRGRIPQDVVAAYLAAH